ncbi:hypothetical protein [Nocardia sp. NPDC057668]|uniref:hypothetical protein n=1 Tax=Nocardia sp. NPDC057668 TaxID=3346202 RepID=UPI00366FDC8B
MLLPTGRIPGMRNVSRTLRVSVATAAAALAVTATVAGCGSEDNNHSTHSTSASATSQTQAAAPAPTAAELQGILTGFADPAKPAADKAKLVVGGEKRLANIETLNQGLAGYQVTFTVGEVKTEGNTATATVAVGSPHGAMPGVPIAFQYDGGSWKLADAGACTLLGMARAACQP